MIYRRFLENKIALITGGSRGIGRATAIALADVGAIVNIVDQVPVEESNKVIDEIKSKGSCGFAFQGNVTDFKRAQEIADAVIEKFQRIDILVNNAGITKDTLLLRMNEEDWDLVMAVNLKGVFNFTKAVLKNMLTQRSGKIINIASIIGLMGNAGQSNYAASKAGIIGFTKSIAKEVASRNIQVNAIAPGYVETDMTARLTEEQRKLLTDQIPMRRTAQPMEIANVVVFLASPAADYITGQTICVDGGIVMA